MDTMRTMTAEPLVKTSILPEPSMALSIAKTASRSRSKPLPAPGRLAVLAVEAIYFLAPNVKQRFLATLPGAILAVSFWIGLSYLLGIYFRHFANFNRTYGTLGGFIALMTWLYWNSFVLLVGAELNAELAKESAKGKIPPKEHSSENVQLGKAA